MTTQNTIPFSRLKPEEKFWTKWQQHGWDGSDIERQYRFHDTRRFRFDFAFPSLKVAVEIDGFGFGHQHIPDMDRNYEKGNLAHEMGWVVMRYTSRQIGTHAGCEAAVYQVCCVLEMRGR